MPKRLDDAYNEALQSAFSEILRSPDGEKANLLRRLRELQVRYLEAIAKGDGPEDTNRRIEQGTEELKAGAAAAIASAATRVRERTERAHATGYEAAKSEAGASVPPSVAQALPDWSPTSTGDPYEHAPFEGQLEAFVRNAVDEEVEYFKQDLKFIRKYVTEDEYARAAAQVLAQGDEEVVRMLADRGIDLNDFDAEDLKDDAARIFRNTKTRGDPRIRGILKELEPEELATRKPALWQRVKRNGTDALPRIMDEVAKDLAVKSPAVELVSWELSSRHDSLESSPDECDLLARQDLYGFGAGLYHPKTCPSHPHTNCECNITVVTRDPEDWSKAKNERPKAFDLQEEEIRQLLHDLPGERAITDAHVKRVVQHARAVIQEVHSNPR